MSSRTTPNDSFTVNQVSKMFNITATKQTLLNAEERGDIPKAHRTQRGQTAYRSWELNQLPEIGERMGFLRRPPSPKVWSVFSLKGGTGKSSVAFQLARAFGLHKVRTLVIGLDAQETITQTLNKTSAPNVHSEEEVRGVYQVLVDNLDPASVVRGTDLNTVKYIPETLELSILDVWLKNQKRREYVLKERLVAPLLATGEFDLILFDCNPAWSEVVTGALGASDLLISPLGADVNSLKAARIFVDLLADFQEEMKHHFEFLIVPTMVETNKLSQNVLAKYRVQYGDLCTAASIRRSVTVQEANVLGRSLMEVAPTSPVFQDFIGVMKEISDLMHGKLVDNSTNANVGKQTAVSDLSPRNEPVSAEV